MLDSMRYWFLILTIAAVGPACSDDGVPQDTTSSTSTGAGDDDDDDDDTSAGTTAGMTAEGTTSDPSTSTGDDDDDDSTSDSGTTSAEGTTDTGDSSGSGTTAACVPITEDPSAIGMECDIKGDDCPEGYTCQGFSGVVFQSACQVICEEDCDCPEGHSCEMVQDKATSWMQCNPRVRASVLAAIAVSLAGCHAGGPGSGRRSKTKRPRAGARERVEQLAAGDSHVCARYSSGRVRCWGANGNGQLGDGTRRSRLAPRDVVGLRDAVDIDSDGDAVCAVHRSGAVSCWGQQVGAAYGRWQGDFVEGSPEPKRVPGLDDAVEVTVGGHHACAIRKGGKVSCWGTGEGGELGDGKLTDSLTPVEAAIDDVIDLALAFRLTCAVKRGGEVWCWGSDNYGTLRREEEALEPCGKDRRCLPRPAPVPDVPKLRQLAADDTHVCGVTADDDRHVMCWGSIYGCAFGQEIPYDKRKDVHQVPGVRDVQTLLTPRCAHDEAGVLCWREDVTDFSNYDEREKCAGDRIGLAEPTAVALGYDHGCAVFSGTDIRCWGDRGFAWLNIYGTADPLEPTPVSGVFEPDAPDFDPYARLRAEVPSSKPLSGFALAWMNATFYRAAKEGSAIGSLSDFADDERYDLSTAQFVVRIAKDHGDFIEVTSVSDSNRKDHCGADTTGRLSDYDLRFFLHEDDLVPVLPHQYADSHEDGSVVFLAAGTPVVPTAVGNGVMVGDVWIPMYSEGKDLELSYSPAPLELDEGVRPSWSRLDETLESSVLGRRIRIGQLPEDLLDRWYVDADEGGTRLVVSDNCRRVELLIDVEDPRLGGGVGGGGGGVIGGLREPTKWYVDGGAAAFWPDGSPAGTLRHRWVTETAPSKSDARRCWPLGGDLRLCHDRTAITVVPGDPPPEKK